MCLHVIIYDILWDQKYQNQNDVNWIGIEWWDETLQVCCNLMPAVQAVQASSFRSWATTLDSLESRGQWRNTNRTQIMWKRMSICSNPKDPKAKKRGKRWSLFDMETLKNWIRYNTIFIYMCSYFTCNITGEEQDMWLSWSKGTFWSSHRWMHFAHYSRRQPFGSMALCSTI